MNTVHREVRKDVTGMKQSPLLPPLSSEQLYSDVQDLPASGDFYGKGPIFCKSST